ncbi:hypothetical protein EV122DRAFT_227129 [Schizophyllum commune]
MSAGVPFCQHAPSAVGLEGTCHLRRHTRPHQLLWGPVPSAGSDPILCFGCEIGPAVDPATLHGARAGACAAELPAKDIGTLQESRCILLFTENGIQYVRYRRLIFALRFYKRLLLHDSG